MSACVSRGGIEAHQVAKRWAHHLWLRAECLEDEMRTPLTPEDAGKLIREEGYKVSVEQATDRIFSDSEYAQAGCQLVPTGSWKVLNQILLNQQPGTALAGYSSSDSHWVLGLKTLGHDVESIATNQIYFAHCFKGQRHWQQEMRRFVRGGGAIWDLEFMLDATSRRRVAAFGYFAGYVGMAVGLMAYYALHTGLHQLPKLSPYTSNTQLFEAVSTYRRNWQLHHANSRSSSGSGSSSSQKSHVLDAHQHRSVEPNILVLGAKGMAGSGAAAFFREYAASLAAEQHPSTVTLWDYQETQDVATSRKAMLENDILVNCINLQSETPPFVTLAGLRQANRNLSIVSDVSCDVTNPWNPLPIYSEETTMEEPMFQVPDVQPPCLVTSISHLPSLLPREASISFSHALLPHLRHLPSSPAHLEGDHLFPWASTRLQFEKALDRLTSSS